MKKIAIVKKQLNKLGYKLNSYSKKGKIVTMCFNKECISKLEVIISHGGRIIVYSPIGIYNYVFISSLADLKAAIHVVEEEIVERRNKMKEIFK